MVKTELRLVEHTQAGRLVPAGSKAIELWYAGTFIGAVYGADGPGLRLITKHPFEMHGRAANPNIMDILINPDVEGLEP